MLIIIHIIQVHGYLIQTRMDIQMLMTPFHLINMNGLILMVMDTVTTGINFRSMRWNGMTPMRME